MRASVVDLRYKMKKILEALERNETVTILYHGQEKAVILPIESEHGKSITEHPFFGMKADGRESVQETMERLRESRY